LHLFSDRFGPIFNRMESNLEEISTEKNSRLRRWLPYAVFLGVVAVLAIPILKTLPNWGIRDWDLFTALHAAAVGSIIDYGQFPFWNPYIGGGNILFAHPEVPVLNPLFLLLLIFGPLIGLKLQVLIIYYIGLVGCFKLSRQLGIGYYASFLPPLVYMLSSYLTLHIAAGHIPFHYFAVFPWLVFFYKKSLDKPIHILSAGGAVAFMLLGSGAAVPLLFSLFFLFLISLLDINRDLLFRPPLFAIGAGVCGVLFGAVKFFPMFDYLTRYPWIPEGTVETTPIWILPKMFFAVNQSPFAEHIEGHIWGWHEYGAFIGPLVIILAVTGLIMGFKRCWPYLVLIFVSLVLVFGSFWPPWSPWDLLHRLPGFESIRVPSRFSFLAVFAVAILSGHGLDRLIAIFKFRKAVLAGVIFAAVLGTHLFICLPILDVTFTRTPEKPTRHEEFRQIAGDPNRMYTGYLSNRGTIRAAWLSAYRHGRGIMDNQNRVSEWYSKDYAVEVLDRDFSPNRIGFDVRSPGGGLLVISQGYDTGWRRTDGGEVLSFQDLVSVMIDPGQDRIEIYYYPHYFNLGLLVSIVSVLAALFGPVLYRRLS